MGVDQVLRVAVAGAVALALAGDAAAAPVVVVVDARPTPVAADAAALRAAFAAAELAPLEGAAAEAWAGRADDDLGLDAALAEAGDGYGQLDCGRARPWAETAALLAAARTAAGVDERARGNRAWSYLLLCADKDGDRPAARHAADRVRALGGSAAISADVWARYPEVDAAIDRDIVAITVTAPAGAAVTLDDQPLGPAPATAYAHAGRHLVAAPGHATWITVQGKPLTVEVPALPPHDPAIAAIAVQVDEARSGVEVTRAAAIAQAAAVELVAVLEADGRVALWQRRRAATTALGRGTAADMVAAATRAYAAAHDRGPDLTLPLVREPPTAAKPTRDPTRWWVYAAIGGALVAGAAAIYAADAGDDHQRFELSFP